MQKTINMKKIILFFLLLTNFIAHSQTPTGVKRITIANPAVIVIDATEKAASGKGLANGSITLFPITGGITNGAGPYTYSWTKIGDGTFSSTAKDITGLKAGDYEVTVTENEKCTQKATFKVGEPLKELTVSYNETVINNCFGGTSTLKATADGGTLTTNGSYTYSWTITYEDNSTETKSTSSVTGKAGVYALTVFDNATPPNYAYETITVKHNPEIKVTPTTVGAKCFNEASGKITFNITGGTELTTGGYTVVVSTDYSQSNVVADPTQLKKGLYYFTVTDKLGCKFSPNPIPFEIEGPTSPVSIGSNIQQTQPSSSSALDGKIKISATGGTPGYTYTWYKGTTLINPDSDQNGEATGLDNGTYSVIVTDANGCTATKQDLELKALDVAIEDHTDVKCFGESTGSITAKAVGGLGSGYTYKWYKIEGQNLIPQLPEQAQINSIPFGTYRVVVNEGQTPSVSAEYTLIQPNQPLQASVSTTKTICYGEANGTATLTVSGGTVGTGYTYLWSNGSTAKNQNSLVKGTYWVTVTDANNCSVTINNILIDQPNLIIIPTPTIKKVLINGQSTGEISLADATEGTGTLEYSWVSTNVTPAFSSNSKNISGLKAGDYTLTVKDGNSCSVSATFTVEENPKLVVSLAETSSIKCFGNTTGEITATVTGGSSIYTYEWSKLNGSTYDPISSAPDKISNQGFGKYKLTITDNVGAIESAEIDLGQPDQLTVSLASNVVNVLCYGNQTGAISINVSGGITPYTYQWINSEDATFYKTSKDLSGIFAGTYSVLITDDNNCTIELKDIIVSQPTAPLAINDLQVKNLTGFETKNGILEVNVTGGTQAYTYEWRVKGTSPIIGSTNKINQLTIGTYVLTVTDQNNCTIEKEYTLTQPPRLDITSIDMTPNTEIKCYGDTTAELTATITGGVPAYIYKWYNVLDSSIILSNTNQVSNLGAGKYIVEVTDQNNNTLYGINEYTITQPDPLAITFTKTEVSCKNGNDGTINLTITGGSSDYNIVWNYDSANNNGKTNITDLPYGTYTVTVSDDNAVNCSITETINITEPANELAISENILPASGYGLSNGKITVQISGGTPTYTYKWFKDNTEIADQTTEVLENQPAGSYKLVVTDSKNCSLEQTFTITEPLELKVNVSIAKVIDCFDGTGILKAAAATGTGVPDAQGFYTYKWYNESGTLINTILNAEGTTGNITKGKYYVTVIDSNNNQTTSDLFEITQPTQIIVTTTNKQDVTCYDGNDGVVEIDVVGGTPDIVAGAPVYTYLWSNGSTDKNQYSLRKGTYSVSAYDGNLCVGTLSNIVIDQPQDFGFDLDKIVPTIPTAGNSDGSLHIEIVGGVAPYRYVCQDSNGNIIKDVTNSNLKQVDFTNLASSIFTISATDATGCTKSTEFDFNNNVLEINIAQSAEITCNNGKNASITAVVKGGFGIRTITWYKNNIKIPNESNALLSNLEIGTYYAIVKDFNKVEVTSNSIVITQPDPIVVTNTQKDASCLGYNDGAIYLTAAGGSNNFQCRYKSQDSGYGNWIAFNNLSATISNLKANVYDIQVQDSKGCNYTSIVNVQISEPKQLVITQKTITPTTGFGLSNGSINITVQGGTPTYNYQWFTSANAAVNGTTATAANLPAGKYYAIVTDAKGCSVTSELYEVKQPDLLVATITKINSVLCNGDKNASLRANVTGGISGYTYKWYSVPETGVLGTNVTLGNLGIGTYYVEVTDSKNNISKSDLFTIDQPQQLDNTLSSDYTLCGDGKDWTITPAVTGGTKPYNYLWNTGAKTEILKNVSPGTYTVTVTDFNGCMISKSITVKAPLHLDATGVIKIPTCYGGSDATITMTTFGGQAPYQYLWNTGEKSSVLSNASAGDYTLKITDNKGCVMNYDFTIENPPKDVIYLGEDVTLCYDQSLTINATIDDDKATYLWTSDKGFKSTNAMITVSQAANYTVVVTNKLGCQATDTINISSQDSAISSEFAMSSQVFVNEKFIIVDISNPKADRIEWKLPPEAIVTTNNGDYAEMSFTKAGEYDITLNTEKGRCTSYQTKTILVTEGEYVDPDETDLQKKFDIKVYPNPSNGIFTVDATLDKVMPASVKVYNLNNNVVIDSKSGNGQDTYSFNFSLNGLPSGIYFVLFESQQGTKLRKLIIQ